MPAFDFLPSFFKYAKRGILPGQGQVDLAGNNLLAPIDWDKYRGPESLAQNPAIIAPAIVPETTPTPAIPFKVPIPGAPTAPSGAAVPTIAATPVDVADIPRVSGHVYVDRRGRPKPYSGELDPASAEKTIAVNSAIENYDPEAKPATGWRKWVPTMISGALRGFGAGGPGGAIFGATEGAIGGALDPARVNREWQNRELRRRAPGVAGVYRDQAQRIKTARDIAAIEREGATTDLARKRADELGKAKPGQIKENERGEWMVIDPVTKTTSPVIDPATNLPAKSKPTGAKEEWVHDENGVAKKYKDGKDTGIRDPGRDLVKIPGYGLVSPGSKYTADQIERREAAGATERSTIAAGKAQALRSQATTLEGNASIWESRADDLEGEIRGLDPENEAEKVQIQNKSAEVARLRAEARQSREDAAKLKTDAGEAESTSKAAGRRAGRKYKVDPKFLQ